MNTDPRLGGTTGGSKATAGKDSESEGNAAMPSPSSPANRGPCGSPPDPRHAITSATIAHMIANVLRILTAGNLSTTTGFVDGSVSIVGSSKHDLQPDGRDGQQDGLGLHAAVVPAGRLALQRDVQPIDVEIEVPGVERLALLDTQVDAPEIRQPLQIAGRRQGVVVLVRPRRERPPAVVVEHGCHRPRSSEGVRRDRVDDLGLI